MSLPNRVTQTQADDIMTFCYDIMFFPIVELKPVLRLLLFPIVELKPVLRLLLFQIVELKPVLRLLLLPNCGNERRVTT